MNGAEEKRLSRLVFLGTGTSQGVPSLDARARCAAPTTRATSGRTSVMMKATQPAWWWTPVQISDNVARGGDGWTGWCTPTNTTPRRHGRRAAVQLHEKRLPLHASRGWRSLAPGFSLRVRRADTVGCQRDFPKDHRTFKSGNSLEAVPVTGKLPIHGFVAEIYYSQRQRVAESTMARLQGVEV